MNKRVVTKLDSSYVKQYDVHIERQKRRRQRLIRRLVLFSFIALLIVGSMTTYHIKQRILYTEKQEQYEQMENHLADLKTEETVLLEEIDLLNDEEYVLEIARTNYFFSKKGEMIFKILDENPTY